LLTWGTEKFSAATLFNKLTNILIRHTMASNVALASPSRSLVDEPVDYRDLKEWIAQQEVNPKPLTPLQQRAIADLKRSLEPDVRGRDWVTMLNCNSHPFLLLSFVC
jgi:hypothetical protein